MFAASSYANMDTKFPGNKQSKIASFITKLRKLKGTVTDSTSTFKVKIFDNSNRGLPEHLPPYTQ